MIKRVFRSPIIEILITIALITPIFFLIAGIDDSICLKQNPSDLEGLGCAFSSAFNALLFSIPISIGIAIVLQKVYRTKYIQKSFLKWVFRSLFLISITLNLIFWISQTPSIKSYNEKTSYYSKYTLLKPDYVPANLSKIRTTEDTGIKSSYMCNRDNSTLFEIIQTPIGRTGYKKFADYIESKTKFAKSATDLTVEKVVIGTYEGAYFNWNSDHRITTLAFFTNNTLVEMSITPQCKIPTPKEELLKIAMSMKSTTFNSLIKD